MAIVDFDPRPDELLYSALARHADRMAFPRRRQVLVNAFRDPNAVSSFDFASRLGTLAAMTRLGRDGPGGRGAAIDLAWRHTLLSYFAWFVPPDRVARALDALVSGDGRTVQNMLGIRASVVPLPATLRYCRDCVKADAEEYGCAHWRRTHQLTGIVLCAAHGSPLSRSVIDRTVQRDRIGFASLRRSMRTDDALEIVDRRAPPHVHEGLALDASRLLGAGGTLPSHREPIHLWRGRLRLLSEAGFMAGPATVRITRLRSEVRDFYGDAFLSSVGCALEGGGGDDWLGRLVRRPKGSQHPLQHLLLFRFLGTSAWDVLGKGDAGFMGMVATGRAPPASHRMPTGAVAHPPPTVGRSGQDAVAGRTGRVRRGAADPAWEARLVALVRDRSLGLRRIARELEVDPRTVQRHARRLGAWRRAWTTWGASAPARKRVGTAKSTKARHRRTWTKSRSYDPGAGITALRRSCPTTYSYLYRYDRQWLECNSPPPSTPGWRGRPRAARVDWNARDASLAVEAAKATRVLLEREGRPRWITRATVAHAMGHAAVLEQQGGKLPLTGAAILAGVEDRESFARRKLAWYVARCAERGSAPTRSDILRGAALRPELAALLDAEITAALQDARYHR